MKVFTTSILLMFFITAAIIQPRRADGQIISEARMMGIPEKFYQRYISPLKGKNKIRTKILQSHHKGSYREIGRSMGRFMLRNNPAFKKNMDDFIDSLIPEDHPLRNSDVNTIRGKVERFFPEILDEIGGFAEIMGIDKKDAIRILSQYGFTRFFGCTILAVGGEKSKNGGPLIGRNYDFLPTPLNIQLVAIEPENAYKSIGISEFISGRLDGVNEHGLFVAMAGAFPRKTNPDGFFIFATVRAILDKAKNVNEAIEIVKKIPQSDGASLLMADRSGRGAVVEIVPYKKVSVRWLKESKDHLLITTNHYRNSETIDDNNYIMPNSLERIHIIKRLLGQKQVVSETDIENVLTRGRPGGVFLKNYDSILGTLYSSVYNLKKETGKIKAGGYETRFNTSALSLPERAVEIEYNNRDAFVPDFISTDGFDPVDRNSFFFQYGFIFIGTPVLGPAIELDAGYKIGLFGTEKTYGPHINAGLYGFVSPAFARTGMKFQFSPMPLFSLEITPFYFTGWKVFHLSGSSPGNADAITIRLKRGDNETHTTPALIVNPIIKFGAFLSIENKFTFYRFDETVYDYRTALPVEKSAVWSPVLQVIIPYSRGFLWGLRYETNYEFSGKRYNMLIGPLLVFPKFSHGITAAVIPSYWLHLSEGNDKWNIILVLRARL